MEEQRFVAVPFALVGFFVTDRDVEESIRTGMTPEELEEFQELVARYLFKEGVRVVIYPSVVPPEEAEEAVNEFGKLIFGEEE